MNLRVLLADDHRIVREGLRSLLNEQPDIEVIAEAGDGQEAIRLAQKMSPIVVVMDINMPNLNGIEATSEIIATVPGVKVVALSMYADVRFVMRALKAGALGYVLKDCAVEELNQAIHTVAANQTYLSPKIAQMVLEKYINQLQDDDCSPFSTLTARERAVLQLLAEGKSTKQIAVYLCLSVKTIETHRKKIMDKLNIHSIAELTKYAIREGLTSVAM
jgi:DNA-binding NarL/FixJ family response regulator